MTHPDTLIFCESPFSSTNGYGVTLATLFEEWPRDKVLQFYRTRRLKDPGSTDGRTVHAAIPANPVLHLLPWLLGAAPAWGGHFSSRWLERNLAGFRPELIYSFYYSEAIPRYVAWLGRNLGSPYMVHIGDDVGTLSKVPRAELEAIYKGAAVRIAISHEMKLEYEKRFGVPFDVLHNGAADELFSDQGTSGSGGDAFVIRYIGSLLRAQHWNAIEDIVEAVHELNRRGIASRFEIYCDEWTKKHALALADGEQVVYAGFAPKPRNYELMRSADLLALPATFSDSLGFYRFSMPTKLPEYLASGTPVLAYGPRGTASIELCLRHGLGHVLTERSVPTLIELLEELVRNREEHRRRAATVREFTRENLSASAARRTFHELVRKAMPARASAS